jgi:hypothetical protein
MPCRVLRRVVLQFTHVYERQCRTRGGDGDYIDRRRSASGTKQSSHGSERERERERARDTRHKPHDTTEALLPLLLLLLLSWPTAQADMVKSVATPVGRGAEKSRRRKKKAKRSFPMFPPSPLTHSRVQGGRCRH